MELDEARVVPPFLYLPIVAGADGDDPEILIASDAAGRPVIAAYTALDRLLDHTDENQPWLVMSTEDVVTGIRNGIAERIVLDVDAETEA